MSREQKSHKIKRIPEEHHTRRTPEEHQKNTRRTQKEKNTSPSVESDEKGRLSFITELWRICGFVFGSFV